MAWIQPSLDLSSVVHLRLLETDELQRPLQTGQGLGLTLTSFPFQENVLFTIVTAWPLQMRAGCCLCLTCEGAGLYLAGPGVGAVPQQVVPRYLPLLQLQGSGEMGVIKATGTQRACGDSELNQTEL